jgi:hypothetical protein
VNMSDENVQFRRRVSAMTTEKQCRHSGGEGSQA